MEQNNVTFMSSEINELSAALSAFQGALIQPPLNKEVKVKTKTGSGYGFKYADLSACVTAAAPVLKENGLSVAQIISDGKLVTVLTHKSGQWIKSEVNIGIERIPDYQALGSAITYLKRYSYCAILGIVADADDDANTACGNVAEMANRNAGYSESTLQEALNGVANAKNVDKLMQLWDYYSTSVPAIVVQGSPFYNAWLARRTEFQTQKA